MKFDDLLQEIGEFGPYQKWIYFFTCIPSVSIGAFMFLNVIVFGVPDHRCKIPGLDNDTWDDKSPEHKALVKKFIPPSDTYPYDRCHLYDRDNTTVDMNTSIPMIKCKHWVYDTSVFKNTLTKQLNLVCDESMMIAVAQTVFYAGVLIGSIILGQLSDIIGRKKTLYIGLMSATVTAISLTFAPEYYSFIVIYFFLGTCSIGTSLISFVIGMEYVGPSKRMWAGIVIHIFGTTGNCYLVLMSYLLRDWQHIELSIGVPGVLYIFYICIIPESPRWLLRTGKREEAERIIHKLAKRNGKLLEKETLSSLEADKDISKGKVWQLFSTKTLAFRTFVIFLNWFIASLAYYGVILNVSNLGGDFYLNLFLLSAVDYPDKVITMYLLNRHGRKKLYIGYMLIGGIACIGTIYPVVQSAEGLHWLLITLSVIGKLCIGSGFEVLYIISSELFPTVVRNAGLGSSSACARVGSMLAPYIVQLASMVQSDMARAIPLAIIGVATFVGGLLSFTLPETLNKKLPDTIEEADNFDRTRDTDISIDVPRKRRSEYERL